MSNLEIQENGRSPMNSQIAEYALKLGRAIQALGQDIGNCYAT